MFTDGIDVDVTAEIDVVTMYQYTLFIFTESAPGLSWSGYFLVLCWLLSCPLLATFLSVVFCLLSLLSSERVPGLFGLLPSILIVADQLM